VKTLKQVAENGSSYHVPFGHEDIRAGFLARAAERDVSVEELVGWACAHIGQIRTQFHDEDKHWTTEDTLDMLALVIVKLRRSHPATGKLTSPETRGLDTRIQQFEEEVV
jgi:hypothetical protein